MYKFFIHYLGKLVVYLHYKKHLDLWALSSIHRPDKYGQNGKKARIPEKLRWQVYRRDNFSCVYCHLNQGPMTLDHVVPEVRKGKIELDNLVTACPSCNNRKGLMRQDTFLRTRWLKNKRKQNHLHSLAMERKQMART